MLFLSAPFKFLNAVTHLLAAPNLTFSSRPHLTTGKLIPLRQRSSHRGVTTTYAHGPAELVVTVLLPRRQANTGPRKKNPSAMTRVFTRIKPAVGATRTRPAAPQIRYTSTPAVHQQVMHALGEHLPERGGLLGGNRQTGEITHFWLDVAPLTANQSTYEPNYVAVNAQLRRWNAQGIELIGMVHSHPGRCKRPSSADSTYARDILRAIPDMERFFMPIVVTRAQAGSPTLHSYVVQRHGRSDYDECQWAVTPVGPPRQIDTTTLTRATWLPQLRPEHADLPLSYRLAL